MTRGAEEEEAGEKDGGARVLNAAEAGEALGFDAARLARVNDLLQRALDDGLFSAAAYAVLRRGRVATQGILGWAQPDMNPPVSATLETVFDLASLTKPMTAILLLQLVARGRLHLGQRVREFLPEAGDAPVGAITLRQLATHTGGLPAWKPLYTTQAANALADILAGSLESEPGAQYKYSDLGYILLGEILARLEDAPLDLLARDRLFRPLGMNRTGYNPAREGAATGKNACAATANCPWRAGKILVGEVHDANAHSMGGVSGHAGLFANLPDLIAFARAFQRVEGKPAREREEWEGRAEEAETKHEAGARENPDDPFAPLGPLARRLAERNQLDPVMGGHSIGWFTPPNPMLPAGDLLSPRAFGHTGFAGASLVFDPEHDLTLILLTNRVYSRADGAHILRLRRQFANLVAGALRVGPANAPI